MRFFHSKYKKITLSIVAMVGLSVIALSQFVFAGNPFYAMNLIYYRDSSGAKAWGDATTVNSFANAYAYRTDIDGNPGSRIASNFGISSSPGDGRVYAAGEWEGEAPAYTSWDIGSTSWTFTPQVGNKVMSVIETRAGMNGWTGDTWVAGAKSTLTVRMLGDSNAEFRDTVMEPIPTPAFSSNTTSTITISWQGLWDSDTGNSIGNDAAATNSIVGYTVYRSANGGEFTAIGSTAQSKGGMITYTDSAVSTGSSYIYKLGVRFEWLAHEGGYLEVQGKGPESVAMATGLPQPTKLTFLNAATTTAAGTKSALFTVQTSDAAGNLVNATSDTTISLTSTSTGTNKRFYAAVGGACTDTVITSLTVPDGTATGQFCYQDERTGDWTITAQATGLTSAAQVARITPAAIGSLSLSVTSPQRNRVVFTGTNTLTVLDIYGNAKTDFSAASDAITFTVSPGAVVEGLGGTGNAQLVASGDTSAGVANLTGKLILRGAAGSYTLTATTASGRTVAASVDLRAGQLNNFVVAFAANQTIDTVFSGTNTVTARDADNNIITDYNAASNPVTITQSGGVGAVSGLGSAGGNTLNRSTDFTSGVATLSGAMKYVGPAAQHTFTISSGSVSAVSQAVTFSPGPFSQFGIALTTPQQNDQPFADAVITAQDVYGNTVTSYDASTNNVTLSVSGTGSLNTTSLTAAADFTSSVSDLSGTLTFTGLVGTHTLTVTSADGKTGTATFTTTPGTPTTIKVVNGATASASEVAAHTMTTDQTLQLWSAGYDISGNWTGLVASDWSSDGTLEPTVAEQAVDTFVYAPDRAPASGTITATTAGLTDTTETITVTHGALHHFAISAPATATAGQQFTPVITAVDSKGNTVLTYTGSKTLTFSGPGNAASGAAPTYSTTVNFTDGVSTNAGATLVKAETVKLTATQGSTTGQSDDIVVGSAEKSYFSVATPGTAVAGTPFSPQITAYDSYGNIDTNYSGAHVLTFETPGDSPNGTAPLYPGSVLFTQGVASPSVTLFKREVTTLKVSEGPLEGVSGQTSVGAAAAASMRKTAGDDQTGPVSQVLPVALAVEVQDAYGNLKDGYTLSFAVTQGGGSLSSSSVITDVNGVASVSWRLGPTGGIANNAVEAQAAGLAGDPAVFTASANDNGFLIQVPDSVSTGDPFTLAVLRMVDANGLTVTSYSGVKTLTFSGPSNGPDGTAPTYTTQVTFTNGVAAPLPSMTLVAVETTRLTVQDGSLSGTSNEFTVRVGNAAVLTFATAPQNLSVNQVSQAMTVCLQDQYGNSVVGDRERTLNLSATSPGGVFSTSPDGPWDSYFATLSAGLSCQTFYYKDPYAGARTITISSDGLVAANQALNVSPDSGGEPPEEPVEPEPEPEPGDSDSGDTPTTTHTTNTVYIYVYIDRPTQSTDVPSDSETIEVEVPATVSYPVITSPRQNGFVTPVSGVITVTGTAPNNTALRLRSGDGRAIAATTSDDGGKWQVAVPKGQLSGKYQVVTAELVTPSGGQSNAVGFYVKQPTFIERIINIFE